MRREAGPGGGPLGSINGSAKLPLSVMRAAEGRGAARGLTASRDQIPQPPLRTYKEKREREPEMWSSYVLQLMHLERLIIASEVERQILAKIKSSTL